MAVVVAVAAGSSEFAWRPLMKSYTVVAMVVDGRDVTQIAWATITPVLKPATARDVKCALRASMRKSIVAHPNTILSG